MCSAVAPYRRWISPRCRARSKTSGWQHDPRAWGWGGCRCSIRQDWRRLLSMPADAEPVAILCLGPVPDFPDRPSLELDGWALGRPLAEFVSENGWAKAPQRTT